MFAMRSGAFQRFCDSARVSDFSTYRDEVTGYTTNPSLAAAAGVGNYLDFCRTVSGLSHPYPVSLEVIADDPAEIRRQALLLSGIGENVLVKIPIATSGGISLQREISSLSSEGVMLNVTAVFTIKQIEETIASFGQNRYAILSIFAGRIADAGVDPEPIVSFAAELRQSLGAQVDILWASAREVLNVRQAERSGADIITMSPSLLDKLYLLGKDLHEFSLETVQMFVADASRSGFHL